MQRSVSYGSGTTVASHTRLLVSREGCPASYGSALPSHHTCHYKSMDHTNIITNVLCIHTVVPLLRDHLQIQRNLVSEKRWSSKGGFIVCTVSASVQGNSGL